MSKRYSLLLSAVLFLFLCLFLLLCFHMRLATDDYYFIWDVRNHGVITGVTSQYMEWCGRFAATFFMDIFYKWFDVNHSYYAVLTAVSILLLFSGSGTLLNNLAQRNRFMLPKIHKWLSAGCFTALLFFLSIDIGESWFWFCSFSSYLWSIIAFIWGAAFIVSPRNTFLSGFAAVLCFIYIGGSSEVYSVIFGLFLTAILINNYKRSADFRTFIDKSLNQKLIAVYLALGISFLIFLIAPGNYLRDGLFPERHILYSFFITAKSFVKFGMLYLPFKLPYIIAFACPLIIFGNSIKILNPEVFLRSFKSFFYRLTAVFIAFLLVFFYMVAYVMVETGPPRIWFLLSFVFGAYCCMLCFYAGYKLAFASAHLRMIKYFSIGAGILLMSYSLIDQYSTVSKYAAAHDERIAYIIQLNSILQKDTLISLPALPDPGMLYSAEIASDTSHFTNKELRLGYDLKYYVIRKK